MFLKAVAARDHKAGSAKTVLRVPADGAVNI